MARHKNVQVKKSCFYFLGVYNMYLSEYKQYSPIKNSTPAFLFFPLSYTTPTRFPSFFPATAHTLKYERSEELGKNLALGGIYRLPKFLKISKQNKFPQKNYRYNIIPLYFETFNKLKSTDVV